MEIHERVKELRKKYLKMSQTAFGERLGVSRSVINNIELNVLARPEQKLSLLKLICKEFSVSEEWLLNGTGEMFASNEAEYGALIDQIMTGENEFAKNIFKTFALFEEEDWEAKAEAIKEMPTTNPKVRAFKRAIFGNAQKCEFDGQGRVIIPPNLIEFARINKELVTVGSNEVVEVWAKEVYEGPISEQLLSKEESYDDLIEYGI